ncbi:AAA family ATPase, partial [Endozoicomonas sp.]|uniref:AAA family ATPase n=1 Tax=Endozoicomonas sp. TaxID=1892382 RepID=UPI0028871A1F|nr:AAA family ATPase [Endozoicomonas sp.]
MMSLPIDEKWLYQPSHLAKRTDPFLIIMMGLSGSGKSTASRMITQEFHGAWICADVVRKHLFGLSPEQSSRLSGLNIYSPDAHKKTFSKMAYLSQALLKSGYSVVIDSAALRVRDRQQFITIAKELKVASVIIHCKAQESTINERLYNRIKKSGEPSEATVDIMKQQLNWLEDPCAIEAPVLISLNTDHPFWQDALKKQLERHGIC